MKKNIKKINKKDMIGFADYIYKERKDYVHYVPMCHGNIAKQNGKLMSCVLGEMYQYFIGDIKELAKEKHFFILMRGGDVPHSFNEFLKYGTDSQTDIIVDEVIDKIEEKLNLKGADGNDVHDDLNRLTAVNDRIVGKSERSMIARAKAVSKEIKKFANNYLT